MYENKEKCFIIISILFIQCKILAKGILDSCHSYKFEIIVIRHYKEVNKNFSYEM